MNQNFKFGKVFLHKYSEDKGLDIKKLLKILNSNNNIILALANILLILFAD